MKDQDHSDTLLTRRLTGILPHIDIAGTDFTIDWRLKELRETAVPWNSISLLNMDMDSEGDNYLCFYDMEQHNVWRFNPSITAMPANVILLENPNELKLDPYAAARDYHMEPEDFKKKFSIQDHLSGVVKPLSESGLPAVIAANLQKQQSGIDFGNDQNKQRRRGR